MALLQQESESESSGMEESAESAFEMGERAPVNVGDPVATIAAGSVLLSWYQFYVRGDKQQGIFVGLWAPTLLAAAGYLQQRSLVRKVRKGLSSF